VTTPGGDRKVHVVPTTGAEDDPAIAEAVRADGAGNVYATLRINATETEVLKYDPSTGTVEWRYTRSEMGLGLAVGPDGDHVYATGAGYVTRLDADTGGEDWTYTAGHDLPAVTVANGTVYAAGPDGTVRALSVTDGTELGAPWPSTAGGDDKNCLVSDEYGNVVVGTDTDVAQVSATATTGWVSGSPAFGSCDTPG
jgi:outer membrane protein assembly factor BamB